MPIFIKRDFLMMFVISGDAQNGDGSLVVSMEINGISYQGVLFAQQLKSRTASS